MSRFKFNMAIWPIFNFIEFIYKFVPLLHSYSLGHSLGIHSWTVKGVDSGGYEVPDYRSVINYNYIFNKKLLDYSMGENGFENDQNDWSILYLPHFQDVDAVIEEPYFTNLKNPETFIIEENSEPIVEGWRYDNNLTETLSEKITTLPTFYFDSYTYRVYVKTDNASAESDRFSIIYKGKYQSNTHTLSSCI